MPVMEPMSPNGFPTEYLKVWNTVDYLRWGIFAKMIHGS